MHTYMYVIIRYNIMYNHVHVRIYLRMSGIPQNLIPISIRCTADNKSRLYICRMYMYIVI